MSTADRTAQGHVDAADPAVRERRRWLGRIGVAAFLFFFIKGILWLAVPAFFLTRGCAN